MTNPVRYNMIDYMSQEDITAILDDTGVTEADIRAIFCENDGSVWMRLQNWRRINL